MSWQAMLIRGNSHPTTTTTTPGIQGYPENTWKNTEMDKSIFTDTKCYCSSLISTGKFDGAAIFSAGGDSVWAASSSFACTVEEVQTLRTGFGNAASMHEKGFCVGGEKYFCIKADDRSIYGKKGKAGCCCVKTKQAILVAHYPETVQPGEAATVIERLADYLIGVGY